MIVKPRDPDSHLFIGFDKNVDNTDNLCLQAFPAIIWDMNSPICIKKTEFHLNDEITTARKISQNEKKI